MSEPYTVADLRRWAKEFSELADWWGAEGPGAEGPGVVWRAQAAAFDALADAREMAEFGVYPAEARDFVAFLKRLMRGEKPK